MPIVEHADVRRMLLAQKAYVEGGLALGLYCARLVDEQRPRDEARARRDAGLLLDCSTPVVKAWPSRVVPEGQRATRSRCIGGYGYTRDYPVEQFYRDNRLNPIHEGTNGIQAMDLLGRKVDDAGGAALKLLLARIADACAQAAQSETLKPLAAQLADAATRPAKRPARPAHACRPARCARCWRMPSTT